MALRAWLLYLKRSAAEGARLPPTTLVSIITGAPGRAAAFACVPPACCLQPPALACSQLPPCCAVSCPSPAQQRSPPPPACRRLGAQQPEPGASAQARGVAHATAGPGPTVGSHRAQLQLGSLHAARSKVSRLQPGSATTPAVLESGQAGCLTAGLSLPGAAWWAAKLRTQGVRRMAQTARPSAACLPSHTRMTPAACTSGWRPRSWDSAPRRRRRPGGCCWRCGSCSSSGRQRSSSSKSSRRSSSRAGAGSGHLITHAQHCTALRSALQIMKKLSS